MADSVMNYSELPIPDNGAYQYVSMPISDVMANIERFVIPENRAAVEYLWDKNILTTQTNNYDNNLSFINIGDLSPENEVIFWGLFNEKFIGTENSPRMGIVYGGRGFEIPVIPGTCDTFEFFKPLFDLLRYQDVQKDGYMTIDEFFIKYTDCGTLVDNPAYKPLPHPKRSDYPTTEAYSAAYEAYVDSTSIRRRIYVFDESKVTKPLVDYLKEAGFDGCFDPETDRVYYNKRLLEGHLRYKEYVSSLKN